MNIPKELALLVNLRFLSLHDNQIVNIPSKIKHLTKFNTYRNKKGRTWLHYACHKGKIKLIEELLE